MKIGTTRRSLNDDRAVGLTTYRAINRGTVRERFREGTERRLTVTVKMNGSDDEKWRLERVFDGCRHGERREGGTKGNRKTRERPPGKSGDRR